jgi:hypothetical protein
MGGGGVGFWEAMGFEIFMSHQCFNAARWLNSSTE